MFHNLINQSILESFYEFYHSNLEVCKIITKCQDYYYLNGFHPLNDFNCECLFKDFLVQENEIECIEWISPIIFQKLSNGRKTFLPIYSNSTNEILDYIWIK